MPTNNARAIISIDSDHSNTIMSPEHPVKEDLTTTPKVSIVIPARNEAASLIKLLPALRASQPNAEIVICDDGSIDDTGKIAIEIGACLVRHAYGIGNGAAIKSGARAANGEIIVFMDADGQHNPDDVQRLLDRLLDGFDMVVGARQQGSQASMGRGLANKLYNWLASYITGHRIDDLTSGFRAVRATKFREFIYLLPNGFSYPTTCTMAFFRAGYSIAYEPIHAGRRIGISHLKPIKDGIRFFIIIFKIGTLYSPLKLFAPISAGIFFTGLGYYLYTFITQHSFTNMSALLFTGSIMVFLMGLISEQITALMYKDTGGGR